MRRKLAWGVLIIVCIGLVYVVAQSVERYEEAVDHGWSQEALRNPFLAAERFLNSQELAARSTDRANVLGELSSDATLLVSDASLLLNEGFADDLVTWLETGGHAIVEAPPYDDAGTFTARFGVYKFEGNDQGDFKKRDESSDLFVQIRRDVFSRLEHDAIQRDTVREGLGMDEVLRRLEAKADPDNLTHLHFADDDHQLLIDFSDTGVLFHPEVYREESYHHYPLYYWVGNEYGATFMQLDVGEGLLSVVVSMDVWNSEKIGLFDHAYFLRGLVENSDEVVFLYGLRSLSFMSMMWENFSEVLLVSLLWLVCWIAYRARRFGPVLTANNDGRRSFIEHIQATGHFLWRQKRSQDLIDALRADLWQVIQKRFPASENLSEMERLASLEAHTRFTLSELQQLMFNPAPEEELQFINMVKSLQEIRKAL